MNVITFPENVQTNSLSILLHGVISLPDKTSYDKRIYVYIDDFFENKLNSS